MQAGAAHEAGGRDGAAADAAGTGCRSSAWRIGCEPHADPLRLRPVGRERPGDAVPAAALHDHHVAARCGTAVRVSEEPPVVGSAEGDERGCRSKRQDRQYHCGGAAPVPAAEPAKASATTTTTTIPRPMYGHYLRTSGRGSAGRRAERQRAATLPGRATLGRLEPARKMADPGTSGAAPVTEPERPHEGEVVQQLQGADPLVTARCCCIRVGAATLCLQQRYRLPGSVRWKLEDDHHVTPSEGRRGERWLLGQVSYEFWATWRQRGVGFAPVVTTHARALRLLVGGAGRG
jgi:hypothetical protein